VKLQLSFLIQEKRNVTNKQKTNKYKKFGVLLSTVALGATLAGCGQKSDGGGGTALPSGGGTVATVNGQAIDHEALRDHLEATNGDSALRQLIEYSLVMQEAQKAGINVSDDEVNQAIAERAKTNGEIAAVQTGGGVRLDALKRQTRYQLTLDKLISKDVKADEATVAKWFPTRAKYFGQPERVKIGFLLTSTKARADAMAAQLKKKSKSFQELVTEQQKANDRIAQGSQLESQQPLNAESLPPAIKSAIASLKPGETSSALPLGQGNAKAFVVVRLIERQPAVKADFAKMKDEAIMDYKLEQVAKKLNAENPQNPPFDKTLEQVGAVVQQQSGGNPPDLRSILSFINQTAVAKLTDKLRSGANVQISDPTYAKVGESFKPAPPAGAPAGSAPKK
jgi:foldase protein PrsA